MRSINNLNELLNFFMGLFQRLEDEPYNHTINGRLLGERDYQQLIFDELRQRVSVSQEDPSRNRGRIDLLIDLNSNSYPVELKKNWFSNNSFNRSDLYSQSISQLKSYLESMTGPTEGFIITITDFEDNKQSIIDSAMNVARRDLNIVGSLNSYLDYSVNIDYQTMNSRFGFVSNHDVRGILVKINHLFVDLFVPYNIHDRGQTRLDNYESIEIRRVFHELVKNNSWNPFPFSSLLRELRVSAGEERNQKIERIKQEIAEYATVNFNEVWFVSPKEFNDYGLLGEVFNNAVLMEGAWYFSNDNLETLRSLKNEGLLSIDEEGNYFMQVPPFDINLERISDGSIIELMPSVALFAGQERDYLSARDNLLNDLSSLLKEDFTQLLSSSINEENNIIDNLNRVLNTRFNNQVNLLTVDEESKIKSIIDYLNKYDTAFLSVSNRRVLEDRGFPRLLTTCLDLSFINYRKGLTLHDIDVNMIKDSNYPQQVLDIILGIMINEQLDEFFDKTLNLYRVANQLLDENIIIRSDNSDLINEYLSIAKRLNELAPNELPPDSIISDLTNFLINNVNSEFSLLIDEFNLDSVNERQGRVFSNHQINLFNSLNINSIKSYLSINRSRLSNNQVIQIKEVINQKHHQLLLQSVHSQMGSFIGEIVPGEFNED